jgi:branched-chain amino acid transport system ATP-binding protein
VHLRRAATSTNGSSQRELLAAGICYVPQGRNIFPQLSVRHNIELGAVAAGPEISPTFRRGLEAALDRFPVLRAKAEQQASTLSGGEQKQLEIARGLLLDPQAGADRRAVDRPVAADGAADLQYPERIAQQAASRS